MGSVGLSGRVSCCLLPDDKMIDKNILPQQNSEGKITQIVTCAEKISAREDSGWSWVVCFAGVISNILICGFTFSYGILFPVLLDEFQQGKANTAWIGSVAMMGIGLYGPLIGKLYQRFGARSVAFVGSIICVISLIATAKASNLLVMFITYGVLFGFGSCGINMITFIEVPRYFNKWRSLSLGLIAMGPGGGLFVMSPLVQVLFERFGWRGTFFAMAGIISVTCVMAFVYQPIIWESDKLELNSSDKKFWDIGKILKHKKFIICVTSGMVIYLGHYTVPVHMVRYLEEIGYTEVKASRLYIYCGLASLLIRPVIGRVNDFSWLDPYYIYTIAAIAEGVITLLLPMASSSLHFMLFFVVYGLSDGTMGSGFSIAVLNSLPERLRPLGFGLFQSLSCITSACGPALGGFVADVKGSYVPVFYMVGAMLLTGATILTGVFCVKKSDKLEKREEISIWEALVVVEKCSVV